ncbi:hypothetical protein CBS147332_3516 [Penicillium roqueforti]|nr:hypothetical protein CBS147332_3516 [Penicillium roqueforti]KAI3117304.1 hypothetical protein CBS147331_3779 [Penicillium roqueforti]
MLPPSDSLRHHLSKLAEVRANRNTSSISTSASTSTLGTAPPPYTLSVTRPSGTTVMSVDQNDMDEPWASPINIYIDNSITITGDENTIMVSPSGVDTPTDSTPQEAPTSPRINSMAAVIIAALSRANALNDDVGYPRPINIRALSGIRVNGRNNSICVGREARRSENETDNAGEERSGRKRRASSEPLGAPPTQRSRLSSSDKCHVSEVRYWLRGSFNICIPISIQNSRQQPRKRVILRFPLPYRIGDDFRPGNGDKKIQCEAGTYAWLQQNCPDIPIPRLYGFALSTGETFTKLDQLPFLSRCFQSLRRRLLNWFCLPVLSNYILNPNQTEALPGRVASAGYLLLQCIEETQGTMLANTWSEKQQDNELRCNFLRDLSRIFLSLSKTPLPRIGSFIINRDGF